MSWMPPLPAARARRGRDDVRAVAGKDHAAMHGSGRAAGTGRCRPTPSRVRNRGAPIIFSMRGMTFSGFFSSSGGRHPSRAADRCGRCRPAACCSSADCPPWRKAGSNQNQRSEGESAFISTSAMRKRSSKSLPAKSSPVAWRTKGARAVAGDQVLSLQQIGPVRRLDIHRRMVGGETPATPVTLFLNRRSISSEKSRARSTRYCST